MSKKTCVCATFVLGCVFSLASLFADEPRDSAAFTPEDEYFLGRAVAAGILETYRPWTKNPECTHYLNLICQTIAINSPLPNPYNGYHVIILDSGELNAFATPGGHIFVTRALAASAPSEDALAALVAHELAHIQLRHGMRLIESMRPFSELDEMAQQARDFARRGSAAGQRAAEKASALRDSVSGIMDALIKNGYSQEQEFEADAAAIKLLVAAGYDPAGLGEMLEVLRRVQSSHSGGFNTTHPSPARRIASISGTSAGGSSAGGQTRSLREARFKRFFSSTADSK